MTLQAQIQGHSDFEALYLKRVCSLRVGLQLDAYTMPHKAGMPQVRRVFRCPSGRSCSNIILQNVQRMTPK